MRLLCSRKSERRLRRVGVVAREWGNMAKHYTVHKAVVACVSGENVARIVARIGEDWRGLLPNLDMQIFQV